MGSSVGISGSAELLPRQARFSFAVKCWVLPDNFNLRRLLSGMHLYLVFFLLEAGEVQRGSLYSICVLRTVQSVDRAVCSYKKVEEQRRELFLL